MANRGAVTPHSDSELDGGKFVLILRSIARMRGSADSGQDELKWNKA